MSATGALIVDVDGVVSPVHGNTAWGDDVVAGQVFGPVYVSPTMCARLDQVAQNPDVTCLWLTDWNQEMRDHMNPFPGKTWPAVADPEVGRVLTKRRIPAAEAQGSEDGPAADCDWWKWWALKAWLDEHPEITTVVWCDDHLGRDHHSLNGVEIGASTRRENLSQRLAARHITSDLIAPATATGLTPTDLELIERTLRTGALASWARCQSNTQTFPLVTVVDGGKVSPFISLGPLPVSNVLLTHVGHL